MGMLLLTDLRRGIPASSHPGAVRFRFSPAGIACVQACHICRVIPFCWTYACFSMAWWAGMQFVSREEAAFHPKVQFYVYGTISW